MNNATRPCERAATTTGNRRRASPLTALFCWAAMAAASGCTTLQTVEPDGAAAIEPGETIIASLRDGREVELAFADWSSEALTGTDEAGILQKIENEEIARVEVERLSMGKSIGLGVLAAGIVAAAVGGGGGGGY